MADRGVLRIAREVADIQEGRNLSLAVASQESDLRNVQALIIGPPGTPYENGFFNFRIKFGSDYPSQPPQVEAETTNSGRCRFSPNIYATGRVCLSILGTWPGQEDEQWSSAQGLESILLSIQSLMSNNPYENEPGFEDSKGDKDVEIRQAYCAKIRHETLRIAVIQKLESILELDTTLSDLNPGEIFQAQYNEECSNAKEGEEVPSAKTSVRKSVTSGPFDDLAKIRFLWYYESYQTAIKEGVRAYDEGTSFTNMPFETNVNGMTGCFQYAELDRRLVKIRDALQAETERWAKDGLEAVEQDLSIAYRLRTQFQQFVSYQNQENLHNIDVSLVDGNPFVWTITYFGQSGSNLDGGLFQIRLSLSPNFPEEQPRALVQTQMYHHRVSKDGVLCYCCPPARADEVKYHIHAMVSAIEEESPPFDPGTIVHAEAARWFWGCQDEKKKYNRAQRKSAQASVEV